MDAHELTKVFQSFLSLKYEANALGWCRHLVLPRGDRVVSVSPPVSPSDSRANRIKMEITIT